MTDPRAQFTYGIEEEFFLVDPETRDLAERVPQHFMRACQLRFGDQVQYEMQRSQVEIATPVLDSSATAREALAELRSGVSQLAEPMAMRLVASGTHPLAAWNAQKHTAEPRYEQLIDDFQIVGRRNLVCGLHVHVAVPEGVDRVQLMNRLMPWIPTFLALSTSSPFWNSRRTGLLSYRQAAYDEWPRSGIPDAFDNEAQYASFIDLLTRCEALDDGSSLWWAIRPSARFPTLELRIADSCTRMEDSLAIAAAFRCLVRAHVRCPALGEAQSPVTRRIIDENRWRAKRYGTQAAFIDERSRSLVAFADVLQQMLALIGPDADALRCESEIRQLAAICRRGTSAHAQLDIYRQHRDLCKTRYEALRNVVDWLIEGTAADSQSESRKSSACFDQDSLGAANA
ncbi:MAG: carboxylate-amine ligase [Arenimonas sp.]|jgi:carboxylate-amine ligase